MRISKRSQVLVPAGGGEGEGGRDGSSSQAAEQRGSRSSRIGSSDFRGMSHWLHEHVLKGPGQDEPSHNVTMQQCVELHAARGRRLSALCTAEAPGATHSPLPQGDLRVVIFSTRVGMRTGPFTFSCFSLAPRIRSAHTAHTEGRSEESDRSRSGQNKQGWSAAHGFPVQATAFLCGTPKTWPSPCFPSRLAPTLLQVLDVLGGQGDADAVDGRRLGLLHAGLLHRLDSGGHLHAGSEDWGECSACRQSTVERAIDGLQQRGARSPLLSGCVTQCQRLHACTCTASR